MYLSGPARVEEGIISCQYGRVCESTVPCFGEYGSTASYRWDLTEPCGPGASPLRNATLRTHAGLYVPTAPLLFPSWNGAAKDQAWVVGAVGAKAAWEMIATPGNASSNFPSHLPTTLIDFLILFSLTDKGPHTRAYTHPISVLPRGWTGAEWAQKQISISSPVGTD
jgi:hypothetical protein